MSENYKGLYIRDNYSDLGTIPSAGATPTYSPDVICYQDRLLSPIDAAISYDNSPSINLPFIQNSTNNIYIRVKNNADTSLKGKVKAFCAPFNVLYMPPQWIPLKTDAGAEEVQLVTSSAGTGTMQDEILPKSVAVSVEPFSLEELLDPKMHTCMMGLVTNSDGKSYIELKNSFNGDQELWNFLRMHPQIAYNNIKVVDLFSQISSHSIAFGNHDNSSRKYILSLHVESGLDTMAGVKILLQSANAYAPFTYSFTVVPGQEYYCAPYVLDCKYSGNFKIAFTMKNYNQVQAGIHVQNMAVNMAAEDMIPDVAIKYLQDKNIEETATILGDCYIYLGKKPDNEPKDLKTTKFSSLALPVLEVPFLI